jgi:hypothetical protein
MLSHPAVPIRRRLSKGRGLLAAGAAFSPRECAFHHEGNHRDVVNAPACKTRETFAALIGSWRDGHSQAISEHTGIRRKRASEYGNQMITNVRHPQGYTVWMVPVVRARLV